MTDSPDTITGDAQPEPPRLTPAEIRQRTIVQLLRTYEPVVDKLLTGTGQTRETFMAQIANAMRVQPKLWECDPATVLGAALRCAQLGMAPNDGTNRAWIIPRKGEATFQLGYGGVLELARRAAPGLEFDGRPVYPNDDFELEYGNDHFRHVPWFARKDVRHTEAGGDAFLWYVRARYPDGRIHLHVLDKNGVEYHRSFSQGGGGKVDMWRDAYDAAALKSVIFDMRRWLPASAKLALAIDQDGAVVDVRELGMEVPVAAIEQADSRLSTEPPSDDDVADGVIEPDDG
jgi:recombination protein RecT